MRDKHRFLMSTKAALSLLGLSMAMTLAPPVLAQQTKAPAGKASADKAPAEAGRVLMAIGEVKAVRNGGAVILVKNSPVLPGDAISTGVASNAQLRMTDGAILALRAQTEFKIDEYRFNGSADGSEKAVLSLVKGGVRAVTGSIGRENKDNLQVNAVVATVGIRGTGFNLNYCENNCVNPDKTLASNGLYAGVFEGQITVKNEAAKDSLGVNEYLYVADQKTAPKSLLQPPSFLPDPLAGQKTAKAQSKRDSGDIPSLASAVTPPTKPADRQVAPPSSPLPIIDGVVINIPPYLASGSNPYTPSNAFNKANQGSGPVPTSSLAYGLFLQQAVVGPQSTIGADGLPVHAIELNNINFPSASASPGNGFQITPSGSYLSAVSNIGSNPQPPLLQITQGTAQQMEGGNYGGIVSWGRWANGNVTVSGYNGGNAYNVAAENGIHYIVGNRWNPSGSGSYTFNLVGATTPTAVSNMQGGWSVTGGAMTVNVGNQSITGNLGLFANQAGGYGTYQMNYSGSLNPAGAGTSGNNINNLTVSKINGSLNTCASGCQGSGNVILYGTSGASAPTAAGLTYKFNTGNNLVQGVAVYGR